MVKCIPEFKLFTVFLENTNIISKIKRSKVTDYSALNKKNGGHFRPGSTVAQMESLE